MIRMFLELDFEDSGGLQRGCERLLGRLLRRRQIDRREDLRFVVLGEAPGHVLESIRERLDARAVRAVAEALVVFRHRLDEEALARGLRADAAPALDRFLRPLRLSRSRAGTEGVADE